MDTIEIPYINFSHNQTEYLFCKLSGNIISKITYVARRGVDSEEGAVQRILNKNRVKGIKEFLLNGGFFPNNVILNIVETSNIEVNREKQVINLVPEHQIAQIIDGQHRIEGIKEAIKSDETIGDIDIPVVFTQNLSTSQSAEIFININTEQKTVPKSLIYDLYGLINISNKDFSIERAKDIADILNQKINSPYQGYIKFPGTRRFKGGIQLSTVVKKIKPLVKPEGEFMKHSLNTLENQSNVLINFFNVIQYYYGHTWDSLKNPFLFASGFSAAIEVYISRILPYCYAQKNFTEEFLKNIIIIDNNNIFYQDEVKGLSGEAAKNKIKERIEACIKIKDTDETEFAI